jgi:hypothetical protein
MYEILIGVLILLIVAALVWCVKSGDRVDELAIVQRAIEELSKNHDNVRLTITRGGCWSVCYGKWGWAVMTGETMNELINWADSIVDASK